MWKKPEFEATFFAWLSSYQNIFIMKKTLIIGYGNPDRQDDGVAWHILARLASRFGQPAPNNIEEDFAPSGLNPELLFALQLTPEMAETIASFERVCFIDAHTGNVPGEIHVETVQPEFQTSPFTHHLTATSCMYMVKTLYGQDPQSLIVSVRGYKFGFEHALSPETAAFALEATQKIVNWINETGD
jgi:hydrogenase maturation protease